MLEKMLKLLFKSKTSKFTKEKQNFKIQNKANISFIKNRFGKDGYVLSATTNYDYGVINIEDTELSPDIETKEVVEESLKDKYQNFVKKRKMSESSEAFSDLI